MANGRPGRPKGGKKYGGRAKGTPNRITTSIKEALEIAFEGVGGVKKLEEWGKRNPTEFFKLVVKLLPSQINLGDANGKPLKAVINIAFKDGSKPK